MATVLLTNSYPPIARQIISETAGSDFALRFLDRSSREDLIAAVEDADYLLVGGRLKVDAEVLKRAGRLRMIQRTGVGLDSLDLEVARQRNIPVYVNKGINSQSVAEHTIMLMLALLKQLRTVDGSMRKGEWRKHDLGLQCRNLQGKTVGLVGLGSIGMAVARLANAFGAEVNYFKPNRLPGEEERDLSVTYRGLTELFQSSDIVSLHCPLTAGTREMIDAAAFAAFKPGSIFINTSRGALVDEQALVHALETGHLSAAGLDVFSDEPLPEGSALRALDNVLLTPHLSGVTRDAFIAMMDEAFFNISAFSKGRLDLISERLLSNV